MRSLAPTLSTFAAITLVFGYTTITNIIERPDSVKIAACLHRHHRHHIADVARPALDGTRVHGVTFRPDCGQLPQRGHSASPIRIIASPDTGPPDVNGNLH